MLSQVLSRALEEVRGDVSEKFAAFNYPWVESSLLTLLMYRDVAITSVIYITPNGHSSIWGCLTPGGSDMRDDGLFLVRGAQCEDQSRGYLRYIVFWSFGFMDKVCGIFEVSISVKWKKQVFFRLKSIKDCHAVWDLYKDFQRGRFLKEIQIGHF